MTDRPHFETRLEERLRARAALASRPFDAGAIARDAVAVNGRRRRFGRLEWPSTRPALGWVVAALMLAISLLGAVAGVGALLREQDQTPVERMTVIRHVIDAINSRDGGSLRSSFTSDGILEVPGVMGKSVEGDVVYVRDRPLSEEGAPEGWLGLLDSWGLEAELGSCHTHRSQPSAALCGPAGMCFSSRSARSGPSTSTGLAWDGSR